MPVFRRRTLAPEIPGSGYARYRAAVREDFSGCCPYCLLPELWAAGPEGFQLDHHRPKSLPRFAHLDEDFFNLFYSCYPCNKAKSNHWPSSDEQALGNRILDFTRDRFSDHFEIVERQEWLPKTRAAELTLSLLNLNRQHLLDLRSFLVETAEKYGLDPLDWDRPIRAQLVL